MALSDRINAALAAKKGLTQAGLARACGISRASVNAWVNGKTDSIDGKFLTTAAAYLGVNAHWLSTGEGPMHPGSGETALAIRAPGLTPAPTLYQALEVVAAALQHADELTLIQVRPLLQRLAEQPQQASQIAPRLLALLDGNPLSTETHDFIKQKQTAE